MNFFYHKDLGNHLLQLCPKVVKHPVYVVIIIFYIGLQIHQIAFPHIHHVRHCIGITCKPLPNRSTKRKGILFL